MPMENCNWEGSESYHLSGKNMGCFSRMNLNQIWIFSPKFFYFRTGTHIFLVQNSGIDYADSSIFVMVEWKRGTTLYRKKINSFTMLFLNCCKICYNNTSIISLNRPVILLFLFSKRSCNYILSLKLSECKMASAVLTGIIKQIHKSMKHTNALL